MRQLRFEILRDFHGKIGMNTTANKFYHVTNLIGLDLLNLEFAHYKKVIKIQFLKFGKTWAPYPPRTVTLIWMLTFNTGVTFVFKYLL